MEDDFESDSGESFGKELAKSVTLSAAGAVAMMVGMYAGNIAVGKIITWRENRAAKKEDSDTVAWESE